MPLDAAPIWTRLQAELRRSVPEATYDIWLAPLQLRAVDGDSVTLTAPAELRAWVAERFGAVLLAAAQTALGPAVARVEVQAGDGKADGDAGSAAGRHAAAGDGVRAAREPAPSAAPNPRLTFEQFVIGDSNRFAHAAALAVAELPGQAYTPLFLYGPPGVGKTHLLHSIANYVLAYGDGLTVHCTTAERFTNEFIAAIERRDVGSFKGRYRHNDVLLIDDVQFLESKTRTQEEFFHTFNAVAEAGCQLVMTSDRRPRDLGAMADRLRARFESGLLVDLAPPDFATRLTVLRKRVRHDGHAIDDDALELIADRVTTDIRALEGALVRVVAFASFRCGRADAALVEHVLGGLYDERPGRRRARELTVERIQDETARFFGLSRDELLATGRSPRVAWPRQVAMFLAREHTTASLPVIGTRFGRDHTTVMHACRRVAERIAGDPADFDAVRALTERLLPGDADRPG